MAAPILWAPGIFWFFLLEKKIPMPIRFFVLGGRLVFLLEGGWKCQFNFWGVGIFPTKSEFFECALGPLSSHPFSLVLPPSFPFRTCPLSYPFSPLHLRSRNFSPAILGPEMAATISSNAPSKCYDRKAGIAFRSSRCCNR